MKRLERENQPRAFEPCVMASSMESTERSQQSPTLLKIQWVAERARKLEQIRRAIPEGSYSVSSTAVARALLNLDQQKM